MSTPESRVSGYARPPGTVAPTDSGAQADAAKPAPSRYSQRVDEFFRIPCGFDWLLSPQAIFIAWVAVAAGLWMPSRGYGFSLCGLYDTFHIPCPACGMTRSVSSFLHGHWIWSWDFHPMGWLVALWFVATAEAVFWPRRWREGARRWITRHEPLAQWVLWTILIVWLLYGLLRIALVIAGTWKFPPITPA